MRARSSAAASVLVVAACLATAGAVDAAEVDPAAVGLAGHAHLGRWVKVDPQDAATLVAADPLGNRVHYPAGGQLVRLGRGEGELLWLDASGEVMQRATLGGVGEADVVTLAGNFKLWATVGDAASRADEEPDAITLAVNELNAKPADETRVVLLALDPDKVPADPDRLAELDYLFWSAGPPSPEQSDAIREWVAGGGRVTFSLGGDGWTESDVAAWWPVTIEPKRYGTLKELQTLVPNAGRVVLPRGREPQGFAVRPDEGGRALSGTILARGAYGFGTVTVLGVDADQPPVAGWSGLPQFHFAMADARPSSRIERKQLIKSVTRTGVTDIATQLLAATDRIDAGRSVSTWSVLAWLAALAIAVGPLDYLLVHKLLKRPMATWITLPLWIAASLVVPYLVMSTPSSATGSTATGSTADAAGGVIGRRMSLLDYDATRSVVRRLELASLHVDDLGRYTATVDPWPAGAVSRTGWTAPPEANVGGLYHPGGSGLRSTRYNAANELQGVVGYPVEEAGAMLLETQSIGSAPVPAQLDLAIVDRYPTGTVTHDLPGDLVDWFIAFDRSIILPRKPEPLRRGQPFPFDRRTAKVRGLRDSLTGLRREELEIDLKTSEKIVLNRQEYDPLDLGFDQAVRTASFYSAIGGADFAGIGSTLGYDLDLSDLLPLGRGVLFGRLAAGPDAAGPVPLPPIQDGERPVPMVESPQFVRIVFDLPLPPE